LTTNIDVHVKEKNFCCHRGRAEQRKERKLKRSREPYYPEEKSKTTNSAARNLREQIKAKQSLGEE